MEIRHASYEAALAAMHSEMQQKYDAILAELMRRNTPPSPSPVEPVDPQQAGPSGQQQQQTGANNSAGGAAAAEPPAIDEEDLPLHPPRITRSTKATQRGGKKPTNTRKGLGPYPRPQDDDSNSEASSYRSSKSRQSERGGRSGRPPSHDASGGADDSDVQSDSPSDYVYIKSLVMDLSSDPLDQLNVISTYDNCIVDYLKLQNCNGFLGSPYSNSLTYEHFKSGCAIYGFDLSTNLEGMENYSVPSVRQASL